jgi:arabinogalactan oligomer / maltooligosaccharide transport system permease protein
MATVDEQELRKAETSNRPPGHRGSLPERLYEYLGGKVWVVTLKLGLLAVVNAFFLYGVPQMLEQRAWSMLAAATIATVAINFVYLQRRYIAPKYLLPGTIFLLMFQVYPVLYTGYLAFTNFGAGHILNKQQAIDGIESASLYTPEDAVRYQLTPMSDGPGGEIALLLTDPQGQQFLGTEDGLIGLEEAGEVVIEAEQVQAVGDYERMGLAEAQDRAQELQEFRVPLEDGAIQVLTFTTAARQEQRVVYDPVDDAMVHQDDGTVYRPQEGLFVSAEGQALTPGWRVPIGFDNFQRIVTSPQVRGPFARVFIWTFSFAVLSVLTTFALGLLLAMALNKPGMRGLRTYRALLIFPFALPSFLTALIWGGMLNQSFGPVNEILNASIPWLNDPMWARVSILLVNLWLGFPYMFIVCLGALQSIPGEVLEAARTDGANGLQAFRAITFPLLLVSLAPLLIASFAFNFNNFNIVYLLTGGGPPIAGAQTPAGHTDILISYTYRLSFEGGRGPEYAFAAAIAVIIFIIVASISAFSFRYTRALEDLN